MRGLRGVRSIDVTAPHPVPVLLHRLDADLPVPTQAHPGDAGVDLHARTEVTLLPGARATVGTGLALALPDGYAAFVHPRSGLAARHGVTTLNAPGTVDAGYRGEICVTLVNTDLAEPFTVHRGDRIAQLVLQQVCTPVFTEVARLPGSHRGETGHGDSGGFGARLASGQDGPEPVPSEPADTIDPEQRRSAHVQTVPDQKD